MHRRLVALLIALLCVTAALASPAVGRTLPAPGGPATAAPTQAGPLADPKASILVDLDTGAVLGGVNRHEKVGVASLIKLMSAVVIREYLDESDDVEISPTAQGMPARKLNLKAGETWEAGHLMAAMLLCSCNDAAVALAEGSSGSLEAFSKAMTTEAEEFGMVDEPVLNDPSGLDDEFSFRGGNSISLFDLAIAARAFVADDELARLSVSAKETFMGGDGLEHSVSNHNRLLGTYPGALGLKTGYTKRTGYSLAGAARRDGRTMLAIVADSPNTYQQVTELLDLGFATPVDSQVAVEELPEAGPDGRLKPKAPAAPPAEVTEKVEPSRAAVKVVVPAEPGGGGWMGAVLSIFVVLVSAVVIRRRQVVKRRQRRRQEQRVLASERAA